MTKPDLPDGWRWARIGEVCDEHVEIRDPRLEPDKPFHYVDITGVDNVAKRIISAKVMPGKDAPSRARQVIRAGDVLVSSTRPNLNAVAQVPATLDNEVCSTGFCVLRGKGELDRDYLFGFVQTSEFVENLTALVRGALYPAVTGRQVRSQYIPLPALSEQKRIAGILNEQMAAVERARAAAEAQLEAAKALPAAYLRAIFTSPEAQQWPTGRLIEVCELLPSKSIATDGDRAVLAVTTACLTEAGFDPSGVKSARMWAQDVGECVLSPGEILVARSNTPELVGRVAMYAGDPAGVVASDLTIRIRPKDSLEPPFLTAYLSFLYMTGYWKDRAGGASGSMKKITRSQIVQERVPVPPMPEQQRFVARLSEQMAGAGKARKALEEQLAEINALPAALLRRAFSGKL